MKYQIETWRINDNYISLACLQEDDNYYMITHSLNDNNLIPHEYNKAFRPKHQHSYHLILLLFRQLNYLK